MVHNQYARPSGEEHAVRAISRLLQAHGHDVVQFTKSTSEIEHSPIGKARAFVSGIHSRASRREMCGILDNERIDVVQVQNLYPLLSPSVLQPARQRGIPVVMRCPNYRLFCPTGLHLSNGTVCERCLGGNEWWCVAKNCAQSLPKSLGYALRNTAARWTRSILNNVNVFTVLSEFQKSRFVAGGIPEDRISVVPNFRQPRIRLADDQPARTISFVGRPAPEKGFQQFLNAARMLPEYPFAVAGDTAHMTWLPTDIPRNVALRGFLQGNALEQFYQDSRILVVPSQWFEGFPNVILDAMAHGKPVLASRIGALPEIVRDGQTGLLFDAASESELVACIEQLYGDEHMCRVMGRQARHVLQTEYAPNTIYSLLMAAFEKAIRRSSDTPHDSDIGRGSGPRIDRVADRKLQTANVTAFETRLSIRQIDR